MTDPIRPELDRHHMLRALRLARDTVALASPNPQVGCVLTRDGTLLGEGAHRYADRDHAEIVALKQAAALGHDVRGATAFVTLEPCSHHGRTGPCADALIHAGIARVVLATLDPNPLVRGQGLDRLRAAGIATTVGVCAAEARDLNNPFAFAVQHRRPFVTLKAALSADGRLAPAPSSRAPNQPFWLTGPEARADVQQLRHASDALLTGVGTVLADNPALTDRTGLPRRRPLLRVVLDTHLRTPLDSTLVRTADGDLLLLCGDDAPPDRIRALESRGVEIVALPAEHGRLSLSTALQLLFDRQCIGVLLEAGAALNGTFLREQLVDRLVLYRAPLTLGPDTVPFASGFGTPDELERQLLHPTRASIRRDLRIAGLLRDPWAGIPSGTT